MGTPEWERQLQQIERQKAPIHLFERITDRIKAVVDGRFTPVQSRRLMFLAIVILVLNLIVLISYSGSGTAGIDASQLGIREYHQLYQVP